MTDQLIEEHSGTEAAPVPAGPIRVAWAPVPKVNLLPLEIIEGRRFRRTQRLLLVGVVATVLVGAGGTMWAQHGISKANDQLTASQSRVSALQAEQVRFAEAPRVIAQVQAAQAARSLAMNNDVLWYKYLNEVDAARPAGIVLNSMTVTITGAAGAAGGANPLTPNGVGGITMSGTADEYREIADWLPALDKIVGLSVASLGNAAGESGAVGSAGINFTSSAVIDSDALSRRYQKEAN